MKKIIIIFLAFVFLQISFTSCEKKANYPWSDDLKYGVVATFDFQENQPKVIKRENFDTTNVRFNIGVPYKDEYSKLKLMTVIKRKGEASFDFGRQYKIKEYDSPGDYSVPFADIVNAVDIYNSYDDIINNDKMKFFVNVTTKEGKELYTFLPIARPDLSILVDQEVSVNDPKVYKITPGECKIGDKFEFKIDESNSSTVKVKVSGGDVSTVISDIIKAINEKKLDNPSGEWNTLVSEVKNMDTYIQIKGNVNVDFELYGISYPKKAEVSGYGPNVLANPNFNFSDFINLK